nr:MAG TPA: hypothetical protein [Caudoviricetes sp.]
MAEQIKLQVLQVENEEMTLGLQMAPEDLSTVHEVKLWKQDWDAEKKKGVPNEETYAKYLENLKEFLGLEDDSEESLDSLVGKEFDVYQSGNKVTLWEPQTLAKAPEDAVGELWNCEVVEIRHYDSMLQVVLKTDEKPNERFGVKFNFGTWIKAKNIAIPNEVKRVKQAERFEKLTGLKFEDAEEFVGRSVMVEVKKNDLTGEGTWLDLKKSKAK